MTKLELQPAHELWQLYQPEEARYAFKAKTIAEANAWQMETRQAFAKTLGFQDLSFLTVTMLHFSLNYKH